MDETHGMVKYAWNTIGYWETTTIDSSAIFGGEVPCWIDWGHPMSMAIDAGGTPHISYYTAWTFDLGYITKTNNKFVVRAADGGDDNVGQASSLALDSQGSPHISYLEYVTDTNIRLKYARKVDGKWGDEHIPVGDPVNDCMAPTAIAVDADGAVHICYLTDPPGSGSLGYVVKPPGGEWEFDPVDQQGDVGYYCSLVLDTQRNPHVSYWDSINDDLRYAVRIANKWTPDTVDNARHVGMYTSIALRYR
jgi:hypothetical protein